MTINLNNEFVGAYIRFKVIFSFEMNPHNIEENLLCHTFRSYGSFMLL